MKIVTIVFFVFCSALSVVAQDNYLNNTALKSRLQEMERGNKNFMKVSELAKTAGNMPVLLVTLSGGNADTKPAVVVVGGVSGAHPLGTELTVSFIDGILSNDSLLNSLNEVTYYVFPNMSPDASAQYFANVKFERTGNATQTDDDRDGRMNEDPYEDLNGDGVITWVRIADATGDWVSDTTDPRILRKVDKTKGEKGMWRLISEGTDNDSDGKFNEDGVGGVAFNRNFTFNYPWFTSGAGEFQVSEIENRAMLDFLYEQTNIFAVMSFGPSDNLSAPMKYNGTQARKRVVSSMLERDVKTNERISSRYKEMSGMSSKTATTHPGDFMQWAYFHFGRFSFSTPGFKIPDLKKKGEEADLSAIRWLDSLEIDGFTNWIQFDHPDFPGIKAEIGGIHPFVISNPPRNMVNEIATKHTQFVTELAAMHPQSRVENIRVENVGKGVFRLTIDFYNSGELPAMSQMGERVKWVMKPKINLKLASGMSLISGNAVTLLNQLGAGEKKTLSWLIKGKGAVELNAGAPQMGQAVHNVELK